MKDFASEYFTLLGDLFAASQATDADGTSVGMADGTSKVCKLISDVDTTEGKIMLIGNGGSAGIASHMATDIWKNGGIRATAFNDPSMLTCLGNDYGYEHIFEKPIEMFAKEGDLLVAISSSGSSENILLGVESARKAKCGVVTLSGFDSKNQLRTLGDINFYVPSRMYGPVEVIHQGLCHLFLDAVMIQKGLLSRESFTYGG